MKTVNRCPKCKSDDITLWLGSLAGMLYVCKKCNYLGPLIVQEDVK